MLARRSAHAAAHVAFTQAGLMAPGQPYPFAHHGRWDSVFGPGYFAAHVLGNKLYDRATLTGNMRTVLHTEFSNESNTRGDSKGVAADNIGNDFKVSVYN